MPHLSTLTYVPTVNIFETLTPLHWDIQRSVKTHKSLPCWNVALAGSIQRAFQHWHFQIKESNGFYPTPSLEAFQSRGHRSTEHWQGSTAQLPPRTLLFPLTSGKPLIVANTAKVVSKDYRILWGIKEAASSNLQCKQCPTLETATQMSVCTFL